jgi:transposase InsO family protein
MNRWRLGRKGCSSPRRFKPEVRDFPAAANNSELRDELLDGELLYTLQEAQILIAGWRRLYNGLRPHSSLGQRPPAPETIIWPGFSLADYGPPSLTPEVILPLT